MGCSGQDQSRASLTRQCAERRRGPKQYILEGCYWPNGLRMQAGVADFADGIQPRHVSRPLVIDHDPTAGVVRGRDDRNGLFIDLNAVLCAALHDGGKWFSTKDLGLWLMSRYRCSAPNRFISKSIARATASRGASSPRGSCRCIKGSPSGKVRRPPSPRIASEIRKVLASG